MSVNEELKKEKKKKKKDKDKDKTKEDESINMDISSQREVENKKEKKKKKKEKDGEEVKVKSEADDTLSSPGAAVVSSESKVRVKREPPSYETLIKNVSVIASPLASDKLTKKVLKCVKKAKENKKLRRGVREVQKAVRKGEKGIAVFAGDTLPIDVFSHLPVLCEQKDVDYIYVPSKMGLGISTGTKRPTCLVMIKPHDDYDTLYKKIQKEIRKLPIITK